MKKLFGFFALFFLISVSHLRAQSIPQASGGGGGTGAANATATAAGPVTQLAIDVTDLNLATVNPAMVQCWTGTTTRTPLAITNFTYAGGPPLTSVTPTFGSSSDVTCQVNASGGAGPTGATGATGPGYAATSSTSLATAGSGQKVFTTQAGLAYTAGARVRATSTGTNEWMEGVTDSYSGTTLTVTMDKNSGTGTHADWDINLAGEPGVNGDVVGPVGSTDGKAALFNGTTGKVLKESTLNGVIAETSGLPAPATANDLSAPVCAVDSVGTDAYAITLSPAIAAYQTNALYCFKAGTANTGASSLAVNGLAATPIKVVRNSLTTDTVTGDIIANMWVVVRYDGTNMVMLNPPANPQRVFNASSASSGIWVCDDQTPTNCGYIYWSASLGLQFTCAPALVENDCNYIRKLAAGKIGGFSDRNGTSVFTITENNGSAVIKFLVGSDATGDIYYRDSNGNFVRLGVGTSSQYLHGGTVPAYGAIATADLPADMRVRPCEYTWGSKTASAPAIANDDDLPFVCSNLTGSTLTISSVECLADSADMTMNVSISGGSTILTGNVTCGNGSFSAASLSGTPTQSNNGSLDLNVISGGTAKFAVMRIKRTL